MDSTFFNIITISILFFLIFSYVLACLYIFYMRKKNVYPQAGYESVKEGQRLFDNGYKNLAIRCYRKATGSSLKEAKKYFSGEKMI